jgi:predicted esterase
MIERNTSRNLFFAFACLLLLTGAGIGQAPAPSDIKMEMRMIWSRNNERYLRRWLMLGPLLPESERQAAPSASPLKAPMDIDFLADDGGEAAVRPVENMARKQEGGTALKWHALSSFHDIVNFGEPFPGPPVEKTVGYAFAKVQRPSSGMALLSVGSSSALRIWLNGKLVYENRTPRTLTPDEDRIEVKMEAGENALLVKSERRAAPWTFCLRILEPGANLTRRAEIGPTILETESTPSSLLIRTDIASASADEAPVVVEVVGAGGKILAKQTAPRGARVTLDTRPWPNAAYEIRCTTRTFAGQHFAAHLPWYKGDSLGAANALIDAASTADSSKPYGFTVRMLAEMVLDRLGGKIDAVKGNPWWLIHSPLMEFEELQQAEKGGAGPVRSYGFVRLAYLDEIDGSPQFCRAYLPPGYDPAKRWPMVIQLHGYNGANPPYVGWWFVDWRHAPINTEYADNKGVIVLEPHGRGNTSYLGLGDRDLLRVIKMAKERFSVDEDRVYLTGESMGGAGVWNVGTRQPEIFAAIAPTYGGFDYRLYMPESAQSTLSPREKFGFEKNGTFATVDSLFNMPIFVNHGDSDQAVNVENSRYVVRLLQRWGFDVRYREHPGMGHEDLKAANEIIDWFLLHKRDANPRHVRVRSAELKSASAYWVRVEQSADPFAFITVDAEFVGSNTLRLDTQNVLELTLSPAAPLIEPRKPLKVTWNGAPAQVVSFKEGRITLRAPEFVESPIRKNPEVSGPICDLVNSPFAVVMGTTSSDAAMKEMCRKKAESFVSYWQGWQRQKPRVFKDTELTEREQAAYSLLLIGGADENLITKKLGEKIPLRVSPDQIAIDGRSFKATDAAVQVIYPSPFNPARYVSVVAGTSADGLYFWDPNDRSLGEWDFAIVDGRVTGSSQELPPQRMRVASGYFDQRWRVSDPFVVSGDTELRAKATLLRAPHINRSIDPKIFDAYVGRYEVGPGFEVVVSKDGSRLIARGPGQPEIELTPESETEFVAMAVGVRLAFVKDASGKVTSMVIRQSGREMPAKKIE